MKEGVSYQMSWPPKGEPTLSVIKTTRYVVKGPLTWDDVNYRPGVWRMDFGHEPSTTTPVCETVEEMLEKGWIKEERDE